MLPYLSSSVVSNKLTAIGYFYAAGKATDMATLAPLEGDHTATPKTEEEGAKWQCEVPTADGKSAELKPIATVGDFVKLCVEPALKGRH